MKPLCSWLCLAAWLALGCAGCTLDRAGLLTDEPPAPGGTGGTDPSGGGGTTSTGGTTGGGGAGAQGGSSSEDCLDGEDNDDNGLTDCADPACQPGHECVPDVPTGWTGFYRIHTTAFPTGTVQPCPGGAAVESYVATPGEAASCTVCGCNSPSGGTCSYPQMTCYRNTSSCSGTNNSTFNPGDGECHAFPDSHTCSGSCSNDAVCELTSQSAMVLTAGCSATGGTSTLPEMWQDQHNACVQTGFGAGCDPGMVCIPRGQAPYDLDACVYQDGSHPCPTDWPTALDVFLDGTDTRDCTACSCDASSLSCTGGKFTVYDDNVCGTGGTAGPVDVEGSNCVSVQAHMDNSAASYEAYAGTPSGSCTASGGQPTGSVQGTGPATFCCL